MERIGSIWTMIVRYLLLVMFGGVIVWACNSAGISVTQMMGDTGWSRADPVCFHKSEKQEVGTRQEYQDFSTYFYEGKEYHTVPV